MAVKSEQVEKNLVKLTFEVSREKSKLKSINFHLHPNNIIQYFREKVKGTG
jgi:hypothetical protein